MPSESDPLLGEMGEEEKRGGKDHYYRLLHVDKAATQAEIKKAYRSLALRLHPDKNPDANPEQWVEIQTAYEVLSDPAKRKIYDKFGLAGLQAQAMYGNALPPGLLAHGLAMIGCLVCSATLLLLLFVIFAGLKAGEAIGWRWSVVFIPLWVLDGAILLFILKDWVAYCRRDKHDLEAEEEGGLPGIGAFVFACFLALQILVDVRLEGYNIAPIVVVIPLLILFGLLCLCCCLVACVGLVIGQTGGDPGDYEDAPTQETPFTTDEGSGSHPAYQKEVPVNIHQQPQKETVVVNVDADAMD